MSAKPQYSVTISFDISSYKGEWDGNEIKMEQQYSFIVTPTKDYAEALFKRLCLELGENRIGTNEFRPEAPRTSR